MSTVDKITEKYKDLPYMRHEQALYVKSLIENYNLTNLCELGHYYGKSSAYFAAILKDLGRGHITTYDFIKKQSTPNILSLLKEFGLEDFVTVEVVEKSWTWNLGKRAEEGYHTKFDFCYIDGEHTFAGKSLSILLVDMLMKSGGILLLDDYSWTFNWMLDNSKIKLNNFHNSYLTMSTEEKSISSVKMVTKTVIPHLGYKLIDINIDLNWIVFQKQ